MANNNPITASCTLARTIALTGAQPNPTPRQRNKSMVTMAMGNRPKPNHPMSSKC